MEQAITVTDVNIRDIDTLWPLVKDLLQRAIDRNQGEFTLEDIYDSLVLGTMTLWIAYDKDRKIQASAVCEMRRFSQRLICYIILLSGEGFEDWHWAINAIEEWARENGADAIAAYTRLGFIKTMKKYGFRVPYTVIQKDLTDRRLH